MAGILVITFEWTRRKCFWKAVATGWGSAGQNRQDLTALETQAWSYELETQDLGTDSGLSPPYPHLPTE